MQVSFKNPLRLKLSRQAERFIGSVGGTLVFVGILVLLNALGSQYFVRADLTRDKIYTLSQGSIDLVQSLDDKVIVKAYFTAAEKLPPPFDANRRLVEDLLREYASYAGANLTYEFIDPANSDEDQQAAISYGVQPQQINVSSQDEASTQIGYMGLVFLYEDKNEVVPQVVQTDRLEYEISSAIADLMRPEPLTIGILQGDQLVAPTDQRFTRFYQGLAQLYDISPVTAEGLPASAPDVLIVGGIEQTLPDETLAAIDQAVAGGTRVLYLQDNTALSETTGVAPLDTGLGKLLEPYGVSIRSGLVLDPQAETVPLTTQGFVVGSVPYELIPAVTDFGQSIVGSGLGQVAFPYTASFDLTEEGANFQVMARSSEQSWIEDPVLNFQPAVERTPTGEQASYVLAVGYDGPLQRAEGLTAEDASLSGETPEDTAPSLQSTRWVAVGSSGLIDRGLYFRPSGYDFTLNAIDWLAQNDALINIRSKTVQFAPLDELSDGTKNAIKWSLIVGLPILVSLVGLVHFRLRARRQQRTYRAG